MERTKNIKIVGIPSYAKEMGKGMFVGRNWICRFCQQRVNMSGSNNPPGLRRGCQYSPTGLHVWDEYLY